MPWSTALRERDKVESYACIDLHLAVGVDASNCRMLPSTSFIINALKLPL